MQPGSFYHLSKLHDSHNIQFACRIWDYVPPTFIRAWSTESHR